MGNKSNFFRGRIGPIPRFDQGAEIALLAERHGDTPAFVPTAIDEKYLARPMPAATGPAR